MARKSDIFWLVIALSQLTTAIFIYALYKAIRSYLRWRLKRAEEAARENGGVSKHNNQVYENDRFIALA
jgi:hypothetical protein